MTKAKTKEPAGGNLISPPFRASFVHLVTPRAPVPDSEPKYSLMVVLPQDNPEAMAFLKNCEDRIDGVLKEKFGGKIPKKVKRPFRDGDEEDNRPEWAGCICFPASASQDFKPQIVDKDLQEVIDPAELYSGAWYRVSLRPYAWEHPVGGKGASFGLQNVQKVKDDEPFSGGIKAADEFSQWEDD